MKAKFVVIMSVLAILPLTVFHAQDTKDLLTMPILEDGESLIADLSFDIQARLYAFNATEGDSLTVEMTQITEALDPFIVILGPLGELIAMDDDSGEPMLASRIANVELPVTGTYFIMATSFQFIDDILTVEIDEPLEFELSLTGITTAAETASQFNYFRDDIYPGYTGEGYSTREEPVFFTKFTGSEKQVVNLEMSSTDFNTILHVFAPGGERIAVNNNADGTDSAIENLMLPIDGVYLIFATQVYFYNALDFDEEALLGYVPGVFKLSMK